MSGGEGGRELKGDTDDVTDEFDVLITVLSSLILGLLELTRAWRFFCCESSGVPIGMCIVVIRLENSLSLATTLCGRVD